MGELSDEELMKQLTELSKEPTKSSSSGTKELPLDFKNFIILLVLVVALLFALTYSGFTRCSILPYWCEAYYTALGEPRMLVIYGDDGLGDPDRLINNITAYNISTISPTKLHYESISSEVLKNYGMIVVTKAKTMPTAKMKLLQSYVSNGGRLIWQGDSGTAMALEDKELNDQYSSELKKRKELLISKKMTVAPSPEVSSWIRITGIKSSANGEPVYDVLNFAEFLKVKHIGNYCELVECKDPVNPLIGNMFIINTKNKFVEGIGTNVNFYGNFTATEQIPDGSELVAQIDILGKMDINKDGTTKKYSSFPMIVSSHNSRVVYYAIPLEDLADPDDEAQGRAYRSFTRAMYNGMLR